MINMEKKAYWDITRTTIIIIHSRDATNTSRTLCLEVFHLSLEILKKYLENSLEAHRLEIWMTCLTVSL